LAHNYFLPRNPLKSGFCGVRTFHKVLISYCQNQKYGKKSSKYYIEKKVRIEEKKITLLRTERSSLPSYRVKPNPSQKLRLKQMFEENL